MTETQVLHLSSDDQAQAEFEGRLLHALGMRGPEDFYTDERLRADPQLTLRSEAYLAEFTRVAQAAYDTVQNGGV